MKTRSSNTEALEEEMIHLKLRLAEMKSQLDLMSMENKLLQTDNDKRQRELNAAEINVEFACVRQRNLTREKERRRRHLAELGNELEALSSALVVSTTDHYSDMERSRDASLRIQKKYTHKLNIFNVLSSVISSDTATRSEDSSMLKKTMKGVVSNAVKTFSRPRKSIRISGQLIGHKSFEKELLDEDKIFTLDMM
mmetsp:Transcript_601/g.788  ORF Transcript_601/g.788 Transcript_601/m.788 type:complete len:196 (-) Transcript_601:156-743(-)|eukprot:CAMPEP_0172492834 /NCGR_PEP_ID=MMETSP1066-20121228/24089_1 /TAXON_ID=671091 /ORGANISM="Coscinodiscus wailesii, Strain CCMP2513" /LENGTH=195 /DNA_ID=CAMNT_0013262655 /DNA_START=65 /DNA_END=652 /DNA_ORIENTATION=+